MNIDCEKIKDTILKYALIQDCERINEELIRLPTHFMYPDGSFIDIFVVRQSDPLTLCYLSDMGQTAAYLADLHIYIHQNKKKRLLAENICKMLNVEERDGELTVPADDISKLGNAVIRLSQACIRISDFYFTQRFKRAFSYKDSVEDFLDSGNLIYSSDIALPGKYDKDIIMDFEVEGRRSSSLIVTLSTLNPASSHAMANEAFRRWYDLEPHRDEYGFLTLYDSSNSHIHEEDIRRLSEISSVFAFPAEASSVYEVLAV